MAWYTVIRVRKPEVVEEAGTFEEEPVPPHPRAGHHDEVAGRPPTAAGDPELRP
jgi:hypothetical protein